MSVPRLLGVDGGGTTTEAWVGEPGGRVIGRGKAGPSNAKAVGEDAARRALAEAIGQAFSHADLEPGAVQVGCLGLAGFDRPEDQAVLAGWMNAAGWAGEVFFVNDGDLVVAAGTPEGAGIGVIAGTGSIAVGRSADGRKARSGGWGHLIGDEGSGYGVALAALRLVARRDDGRDRPPRPDALSENLCMALGVDRPSRIVSALYAPGIDRTRIAALAPVVVASSEHDPEVERLILRPAGRSLAEQAVAVARALDWPKGPIPLAVAGGFLLAAPIVLASLCEGIREADYVAEPTAVTEPVRGALILAEGRLTGPGGGT